jgi:DUF971 family protein
MQKYDLNDIVLYEGKKFKVVKVYHYINSYEQGWVYAYDLVYHDTGYYPLQFLDYILQRKLSLYKKYLSTISMQTSLYK